MLLAMLTCASVLQAQVLDQPIKTLPVSSSILQHLEYIDRQIEPSLSYASSRFDADKIYREGSPVLTVSAYIRSLLVGYEVELEESGGKILIIVRGPRRKTASRVYGYIRDVETGEVLAGAIVRDTLSGRATHTNEAGFYNLTVRDRAALVVHYLGYEDGLLILDYMKKPQQDISLSYINRLDPVVITSTAEGVVARPSGGKRLDVSEANSLGTVTGDADLVQLVKQEPGVQSGSEGQGGFYVRGGGPDQNLILLDGVAMYEVSHTAGMSSIFMKENIREAILHKDAFSAEYGGRLSSVLNISLKDGHYKEVHGAIDAGLTGARIHLEGPLNAGSTAFNFSAKTSWINLFLDRLINDGSQYDDIDVGYKDATFKLSHRFSPTTRISYTLYSGSDAVELSRFEGQYVDLNNFFEFDEDNFLDWGSSVHAINFDHVLNDKFFLQVHLGRVNYSYTSAGVYSFSQFQGESGSRRDLNVSTETDITDYSASTTLEYYPNSRHKIKGGLGLIYHDYLPALKTSDIRIAGQSTTVETAIRNYITREFSAFLNDTWRISDRLRANLGLRFSYFSLDAKSYQYVEPRLALSYALGSGSHVGLSISRMVQNVHLLVNPGIGLPSDLWVPSTENIAPERSDQVAIKYEQDLGGGLALDFGAYYKIQHNLLEYGTAIDLFYALLNDDIVIPIDVQNRDWEERVQVGKGESYGAEWQLSKRKGKVTGYASYALSWTNRTFDQIDNGETFPYRYDRRHDVNLGLQWQISKKLEFGTQWVYGSGYAFTLGLEEIIGPDGKPIILPGKRNNFRMPAYHQLSLQGQYVMDVKPGQLRFQLGVYNIYNRLNPYFIYLYNNRLTDERAFRQVSLFPILPTLHVGYTF